jgi:hypothetical protein
MVRRNDEGGSVTPISDFLRNRHTLNVNFFLTFSVSPMNPWISCAFVERSATG